MLIFLSQNAFLQALEWGPLVLSSWNVLKKPWFGVFASRRLQAASGNFLSTCLLSTWHSALAVSEKCSVMEVYWFVLIHKCSFNQQRMAGVDEVGWYPLGILFRLKEISRDPIRRPLPLTRERGSACKVLSPWNMPLWQSRPAATRTCPAERGLVSGGVFSWCPAIHDLSPSFFQLTLNRELILYPVKWIQPTSFLKTEPLVRFVLFQRPTCCWPACPVGRLALPSWLLE